MTRDSVPYLRAMSVCSCAMKRASWQITLTSWSCSTREKDFSLGDKDYTGHTEPA